MRLSTHQQPDVCLWGALGVCLGACLVLQPQFCEPGVQQWDSVKNAFPAQAETLLYIYVLAVTRKVYLLTSSCSPPPFLPPRIPVEIVTLAL